MINWGQSLSQNVKRLWIYIKNDFLLIGVLDLDLVAVHGLAESVYAVVQRIIKKHFGNV